MVAAGRRTHDGVIESTPVPSTPFARTGPSCRQPIRLPAPHLRPAVHLPVV